MKKCLLKYHVNKLITHSNLFVPNQFFLCNINNMFIEIIVLLMHYYIQTYSDMQNYLPITCRVIFYQLNLVACRIKKANDAIYIITFEQIEFILFRWEEIEMKQNMYNRRVHIMNETRTVLSNISHNKKRTVSRRTTTQRAQSCVFLVSNSTQFCIKA